MDKKWENISNSISEKIHVNQLGYRCKDKKVFVVSKACSEFHIISEDTSEKVFTGSFRDKMEDKATSDTVLYGDFSELTTPGSYYISIDGIGRSFSFTILNEAYKDVKNALLKVLYYQRCGTELQEAHAHDWKHGLCHKFDAKLYEAQDTIIEVSGGWHDAGDYGRYVVPAAKAIADLLLAYEYFPKAFTEQINIPESGNAMPDILNEAKYEIDWLFKMQDTLSGGVYHKVTTKAFCGMIMPEDEKQELYVLPISSTATGDFSAVMALASRIYKDFDKELSDKCLSASLKAWKWLKANQEPKLFKNPSDVLTGEYGDKSDLDERYWAAAELYRTTGDKTFFDAFYYFLNKLDKINLFGWADVSGYGTISYLFSANQKVDEHCYEKVKKSFIDAADALGAIGKAEGYKVTLKPDQYAWGSSMSVLNNAMHLILANLLNPKTEYLETAVNQWHYILGMNSLSQSFISGYGSKPIMHPHHRPSEADGILDPVPGMVSGGPCSKLLDDDAKKYCEGMPPAKCFIDVLGSYSTNEICVYWNSPGVFVAGFLNN